MGANWSRSARKLEKAPFGIAKNGIRAKAICPGLVKTERVMQRFGNADEPDSGSAQAQALKGAGQAPVCDSSCRSALPR
jgi:hypothetical protein